MPIETPRKLIEEFYSQQKELSAGAREIDEATICKRGAVQWAQFDEHESSFAGKFKGLIFPSRDFREYFVQQFPDKMGKMVGLEIGGYGYNFFSDLNGVFKRSAAICLTKGYKPAREAKGKLDSHFVIEGDVMSPRTFAKPLRKFLKGEKIDFAIERMSGGLNYIVNDPRILYHRLRFWYRMMAPDGQMFFELPRNLYVGTEELKFLTQLLPEDALQMKGNTIKITRASNLKELPALWESK